VVEAYDADQAGELYFYVMEFVDGEDLDRLVLKNGPLPVHRACDYVRQAALGLQHAHEQGFVHRDIKPGNLLVTADGTTVKLLDLGLARMRRPGPDGRSQTAVTQIGIFIGTPDFVAPEQAVNSRDVDIRADLYSLGCTFYYLLTGQAPFAGLSVMDKLLKHKTEHPVRVESTRADVPRKVSAILRKLMAKRPEDRYRTPAEAAEALAPFCRPEVCRVNHSASPHSKRGRRRGAGREKQPELPSTVIVPTAEAVDASAIETPRPSLTKVSVIRAFALANRPRSWSDWYRWALVGGVTLLLFGLVLLALANLVGSRPAALPPQENPPGKAANSGGDLKKSNVRR
jgi:serine/threonine protein kinase